MNAPDPPLPAHARLAAITSDLASATADGASHEYHKPLSAFLAQVRDALGMDVAFVSEFLDERRVFQVVSAALNAPLPIRPGQSDALLDTYCQRIVQGALPLVIPDTGAAPEAGGLPITQQLGIGAYLSAPIVLAGNVVFGTLCCFSRAPRADLSDVDAQALRAVADVIAASIDRRGRMRSTMWMQHKPVQT